MHTSTLPVLENVFLTRDEVARMLRVSQLTIYRLVDRGLLPCYHVARRVRFALADVHAYLATRRTCGDANTPYGGSKAP